jgi:RimJ/RimL family protein N-acetyltransferase
MLTGDRLPTIESRRVRLRWLTEADIPALVAIFSHPEVTRYWSTPPHTGTHQAEELLSDIHRHFHDRTLFQWGVAQRQTDRIIATTTLWQIDADNRRAEIGFALQRDYWGQGLMQETLQVFLAWCFDELQLRRIEADVDPDNSAALRLLEKLGFEREGLLRERWHVGGDVQDSVILGLLARDLVRG